MAHKPKVAVVRVHKQNSHGGWVPKVTRSTILLCSSCKTKYIKTREGQVVCIKCMRVPAPVSVFRLRKD